MIRFTPIELIAAILFVIILASVALLAILKHPQEGKAVLKGIDHPQRMYALEYHKSENYADPSDFGVKHGER